MPFANYSCKTGKWWNQHFVAVGCPQIVWVKWDISNFDSDPMTCDAALFPARNSPKEQKVIIVFQEKGQEVQMDGLMAKVSPRKICIF